MITRRRILLSVGNETGGAFVDLGLPSGTLWAQGNIVKDEQGNYSMGNETDYGCYFSWGNIDGHNTDEGYDFGESISGPYANTPGAQVSADIASNDSVHNAVFAYFGSPWSMSTMDDFVELNDNCTSVWVTNYNESGVAGRLFTSKINGVTLFFPAAGYCTYSSVNRRNSQGLYWSCLLYDSNRGRTLNFRTVDVTLGYTSRCYGLPIRAVKSLRGIIDGYEYVDLGLPSGLKWATCNVGAVAETGYGNYYQWGAGATTYKNEDQYYTGELVEVEEDNILPSSADTATQVMKNGWRMPTADEMNELTANTTYSWVTINGISGGKFISRSNPNAYVFFPAAGYYVNGSLSGEGSRGDVWSISSMGGDPLNLRIENDDSVDYLWDWSKDVGLPVRGVHE